MAARNYVLGRGRIFVAKIDADTEKPGPFRYVGNTTEFNLTAETEDLEHTDSDRGINEVDDQVQLSVTRSGTLTMDDIQRQNLALFFFGTADQLAARAEDGAAATRGLRISGDDLTAILEAGPGDADFPSLIYLGDSSMNGVGQPSGDIGDSVFDSRYPLHGILEANLALAGMSGGGAVVLDKDTDWAIADLRRGSIRLIDTAKTYSAVGNAVLTQIDVTYRRAAIMADTLDQVISGGTPFEGAIRFEENNPKARTMTGCCPR